MTPDEFLVYARLAERQIDSIIIWQDLRANVEEGLTDIGIEIWQGNPGEDPIEFSSTGPHVPEEALDCIEDLLGYRLRDDPEFLFELFSKGLK